MGKIISVRNLCKTYIVNDMSSNVLQNVDLEINDGEFVSVMGPSGSGKSTLLYTVSGMDMMTSGKVLFKGRDLAGMTEKQRSLMRLNDMGFIFQQMYMMKKLCIFDNIVLPGYQARKKSRKEINEDAKSLMRRTGIIECADHGINEVSGGQLQRACLCRALINKPDILFADEPTGSLNSRASEEVMNELLNANRDGAAVMMVTHSVRVAAMSDRVLYLSDGDIKGEKILGKFSQNDLPARERELTGWLMEYGW